LDREFRDDANDIPDPVGLWEGNLDDYRTVFEFLGDRYPDFNVTEFQRVQDIFDDVVITPGRQPPSKITPPLDLPSQPLPPGPPLSGGQPVSLLSAASLGAVLWLLLRVLGKTVVVPGARIVWTKLPWWVRQGLVGLGLLEGVDILLDLVVVDDPDEQTALDTIKSVIPATFPFVSGGSQGATGGAIVTMDYEVLELGEVITIGKRSHVVASWWIANGVVFYRFIDGWLGVRNKHGVWKNWKPRGGVVLNTTGGNDFDDVSRAASILLKEKRRMDKVLSVLGFKTERRKS